MVFDIQNFEGERIIQATFYREFCVREHLGKLNDQLNIVFEVAGEGVHCIFDVRELALSVPEVMEGLNKSTRRGVGFLHHHHLEVAYVVSNSAVMDMAARALRLPHYGKLKSHLVRTPEKALTAIRDSLDPRYSYELFKGETVVG